MPRIIFKNIDQKTVQHLSQEIGEKLATIIKCPCDWITFEQIENHTFCMGKSIKDDVIYVEVSWFKREQKVQDALALEINSALQDIYSDSKEITIIFNELSQENYYENGVHY